MHSFHDRIDLWTPSLIQNEKASKSMHWKPCDRRFGFWGQESIKPAIVYVPNVEIGKGEDGGCHTCRVPNLSSWKHGGKYSIQQGITAEIAPADPRSRSGSDLNISNQQRDGRCYIRIFKST